MQNKLTLIAITLTISALSLNVYGQWEPKDMANKPLKAMFFYDQARGCLVGDSGTIWNTTDGGYSWKKQNFFDVSFLDVHFPTISNGYAAGYSIDLTPSLVICKTTDTGNSWTIANSTILPTLPSAIHFTDNATGYIVGGLSIAKTTDNGVNWTTTSTTETMNDIWFLNSSVGFAVGNNTTLKKTTDAGDTWSNVTIDTSANLLHIHFADEQNGFIAGRSGSNSILLRTTDGGTNWEIINGDVTVTTTYFNALFMASKDTIYAAGKVLSWPIIIRSTDGGTNWEIHDEDLYDDAVGEIKGLSFRSGQGGFSIAATGELLCFECPTTAIKPPNPTTNIPKYINKTVEIYPNPFNDFIIFEGVRPISIVDINGKEMINEVTTQMYNSYTRFNTKNLIPGIYLVSYQQRGMIKSTVIIK